MAKSGACGLLPRAQAIILRCPACHNIILRLAVTPEAVNLDARGAAYLRIPRRLYSEKGLNMVNQSSRFGLVTAVLLLFFASAACGLPAAAIKPTAASLPQAPIAPIDISGDLTKIDLCQAVPKEDIQAVMGRPLITSPKSFNYYDTPGVGGCTYDSGKDSTGEAHFGYIAFTPASVYSSQPLYQNTAVSGFGVEAYFNNGADARQLWVKVNDTTAFVVAFGDVPNETGARAIAKLVLAEIKSP